MHKDLSRPLVVCLQTAFLRCVIEPNRKKRFPDAYEHSCACFDAAHHNGFSGFSGVGKRSTVSPPSSWKPTESMMDKWRLNWSVCNPVWFKSTLNHCSAWDQLHHRSAWAGTSFSFENVNIEDSFINSLSTLSLTENMWTTSHSLSILRGQSTEVASLANFSNPRLSTKL